MVQGNLERECIEEECSYEECYEVTDQKNTAGNSVKILKNNYEFDFFTNNQLIK